MSTQYSEAREKFLAEVRAGLSEPAVCVHVIPIGEGNVDVALGFAKRVREAGVSCIVDARKAKVKKILGLAAENLAYFAVLIGDTERASRQVVLRDLDECTQETLYAFEAVDKLAASCRTWSR